MSTFNPLDFGDGDGLLHVHGSTVESSGDPGLTRLGSCQHPGITDEALLANAADIVRSWGNVDPLRCLDCNEWLYVHGDADEGTVYAGEPFGAGADYWGRPSASTHPEYWRE